MFTPHFDISHYETPEHCGEAAARARISYERYYAAHGTASAIVPPKPVVPAPTSALRPGAQDVLDRMNRKSPSGKATRHHLIDTFVEMGLLPIEAGSRKPGAAATKAYLRILAGHVNFGFFQSTNIRLSPETQLLDSYAKALAEGKIDTHNDDGAQHTLPGIEHAEVAAILDMAEEFYAKFS